MSIQLRSFVLALATVAATCAWAPSDARSENPGLTTRAKAFIAALAGGKLDRSLLAPAVADALSDDVVGKVAEQLHDAGDLRWTFVSRVSVDRHDVAFYRLTSRLGVLRFSFGADSSGRVWDFRLRPETGDDSPAHLPSA